MAEVRSIRFFARVLLSSDKGIIVTRFGSRLKRSEIAFPPSYTLASPLHVFSLLALIYHSMMYRTLHHELKA
jgi:hypothetical protein